VAHRSYCAENPPTRSNERQEVRASVVNSAVLAEVAADLEVGAALLLGKGEAASGGSDKPSILADATEALIGAVYLDGGWSPAAAFVLRLLGDRILEAAAGPGGQDHKTRLQELASRRFGRLPAYSVVDAGPDHAKRFVATVVLDGRRWDGAEGRSKKQAEQSAAREAWASLSTEPARPAVHGAVAAASPNGRNGIGA